MRTSSHVVSVAGSLRGCNQYFEQGSVNLRLWSDDEQLRKLSAPRSVRLTNAHLVSA
jgi:hypothetical protein